MGTLWNMGIECQQLGADAKRNKNDSSVASNSGDASNIGGISSGGNSSMDTSEDSGADVDTANSFSFRIFEVRLIWKLSPPFFIFTFIWYVLAYARMNVYRILNVYCTQE